MANKNALNRQPVRLEGMGQLLDNLNKEIKGNNLATRRGITKSVLLVERESKQECPVDLGNLKNSGYTEVFNGPNGPAGAVGYTAVYALRQHEEVTWNHTVGKAKFLEDPLKRNEKKILEILKYEAHRELMGKAGMVYSETKAKSGIKFKEKKK